MGEASTYKLGLRVPRRIHVGGGKHAVSREDFAHWLWSAFQKAGLIGVHEGTLLTDEAARQGLETESWTVDAGEAPRERDWVGNQERIHSELYFSTRKQAESAARRIAAETDAEVGEVAEVANEDWDAQWKASFTGARIPPFWRILPPWSEERAMEGERILRINPGAGFGTGTHETTQLCLQAIGELGAVKTALDFGSGSGILAIGAALLGARVDAIEIDPLAIDNGEDNARLNDVVDAISYSQTLEGHDGPYALVIANILRPVLLEFSEALVRRVAPDGALVLSGLIESDVAEVCGRFSGLLGSEPRIYALGEWRALRWRMSTR